MAAVGGRPSIQEVIGNPDVPKTSASTILSWAHTFRIPSIGFPRYARFLSDFWSDHPQADRLGSLLTIGHVNSDALGLC